MTTTAMRSPAGSARALQMLWAWIKRIPPVYFIFFAIFIVLGLLNHNGYQTMNGVMTFLRTASPLAILAIGEMMVLALGGFDLSIGSMVTMVVLASSLLLTNDPARAYQAIVIMLGLGFLIGLANGLVVSYMRVPS